MPSSSHYVSTQMDTQARYILHKGILNTPVLTHTTVCVVVVVGFCVDRCQNRTAPHCECNYKPSVVGANLRVSYNTARQLCSTYLLGCLLGYLSEYEHAAFLRYTSDLLIGVVQLKLDRGCGQREKSTLGPHSRQRGLIPMTSVQQVLKKGLRVFVPHTLQLSSGLATPARWTLAHL